MSFHTRSNSLKLERSRTRGRQTRKAARRQMSRRFTVESLEAQCVAPRS